MHLKRNKTPKNWTLHRKGTKYVVRPNFGITKGVPVLVVLRDMLKVAQNRKEVKRAIHAKKILLNNKIVTDEKNNALLFDVITIAKKNYRIVLSEKGKFQVEEIPEEKANYKTAKVINKKSLKGKKTQLNLSDGRNFISKLDCKVNDSVLINFKEKKIEKYLPLKEKTSAFVFAGKHAGEKGIIEMINQKNKIAELIVDKNKVNVLIKHLIVVE